MLTVADIDEASLESGAKAAEWEADFLERFHEPEIVAQRIMALLSATPEEQQQIRRQFPEQYRRLSAHIERLKGYSNGTGGVNL